MFESILAAALPAIGTALAGIGGGNSNRVSNRDFQHAQNLADQGNPREIARQSDFLQGIAPAQAGAHNTFQDQTYGQDTNRQISRIQTMGSELGMSPWELAGQGAASPLPTPQMSNGSGSQSQFLGTLAPLAAAEANNKTALKQTAMQLKTQKDIANNNNQTALQQTSMQTGNASAIANQQTAGGALPQQQALESAARRFLIGAQTRETTIRGDRQAQQTTIDFVDALMRAAPTDTYEGGGWTRKETPAFNEMAKILAANNATEKPAAMKQAIMDYLNGVKDEEVSQITKDLRHIAGAMASFERVAGSVGTGMRFLGNLVK